MDVQQERRHNPTVANVRDWITDLRQLGGDFDPEAARVAGDAAFKAMRTGAPMEAVFETARIAYYNALVKTEYPRPA